MLYKSRKSIDTYLKITVPLLALRVPQRTFNIHESGYLKVKSGKSWERAWCLKMLSKIDSSLGFGTELIYYSNNTQRFSLRSLTSTWPEEQHSNNRRKTIFFFTHHLMKTKKSPLRHDYMDSVWKGEWRSNKTSVENCLQTQCCFPQYSINYTEKTNLTQYLIFLSCFLSKND